MTERVTRCHGEAAAETYYAEGVMGGRESAEWQSCLGVMLTAGPCDDRELP